MKKEAMKIVKKAARIAGVTCIAAGAIAIVTSKTAVQAIVKGGEYLKDAVQKIMDEEPKAEKIVEEAAETAAIQEEPAAAEETPAAEENT